MSRIVTKKAKFNDVSKIRIILILLVIVIALSISIPSLARYKNFINLEAMFNEAVTWDGSVAASYNSGTGTIEDPYIISNASEFAYFAQEANKNDGYEGGYFKLSNNIILNNGLFGYGEGSITYTLNDTLFYLDKYTGNAYDNKELTGNIISTINIFESLSEFKGHFDGDYYSIYGLYLTEDREELALINKLYGTFENVYFKNSLIYGGSSAAILANDAYGDISNVSTDGVVVSTGDSYDTSIDFSLDDLNVVKDTNVYSYNYDLNIYDTYNFDKIIIKGMYSSTLSDQVLTINGEEVNVGEFEINLGTLDSLNISINDNETSEVSISNIVLQGIYNYPIASGLVGMSSGSNLTNVINKANVYGVNVSGLVGVGNNLSINNSYNLGSLYGDNVAAIINRISDNGSTVINKVYNNGELHGTKNYFVGDLIKSELLVVGNSFNTKLLTSTFGNVSGSVEVLNMYDVNSTSVSSGILTNNVNIVTIEEIDKELLESIGYLEYVDNDYLVDNPNNMWVYEYEEFPILYVDELNNPIASLNIGVYSWNDLGYERKTIDFTESKAFNITPLNGFNNFKNVYYYIYDGEYPLNRNGIESIEEWVEYEDVVSLDKEGKYIVYIKIVDQEDRNYYINSDVLFFDLEGPIITLNLNSDSWNSYNDNLSSKYISDTVLLSVDASDSYSDVVSTEYYVSDIFVTKEKLENVEWIAYESGITLDSKGTSVVYVKSIDNNGHTNIINSDYIIYGGYKETLNVGINTEKIVEEAHITSKSSVIYKFTYDENIAYSDGYNSNLVLSNILPKDTLITLIDHKLNKIYSYVIDNEDLIIPLSKFMAVGVKAEVLFDEVAYVVTDKKDISVIFDFNNTEILSDFAFNAYLDLRDELGNVVLSTLKDSIKNTYVYSDLSSSLTINNKSVIYGINYDSDSKNLVEFEYSFDSLVKANVVVTDTSFNNMKTGILIKLVDSEGVIVDKKYLKNMEFIIDGVNYFADSDGIVRINLSDNLDKVNSSLTIVTHENDLDLSNGNYSLVIVPFVANDGRYTDTFASTNISIPVVSDYEEILDYEFNVSMDDSNKILIKETGNVVIPFKVVSNNEFNKATIRVSLYKKNELTAYDQSYSLIDLGDYSSNELELATDYSYVINDGEFELDLNLSNLDKTGYELRFELFDGDKKIDLIKKKFIVR